MIFNPTVAGTSGGGVQGNIEGFGNSIIVTKDGYVTVSRQNPGIYEVIKGSLFVAIFESRDYPTVTGGVEEIYAGRDCYIYYVTGDFHRTY